MTRVAAIYDIHGNLPALEATLTDIETLNPDLIVVGGDVASGPMPQATLDRLMILGSRARFIRGNADRWVVDAFDGLDPSLPRSMPAEVDDELRWTAEHITRPQRDFLASFPEQVVVDIDGMGQVLFCHGSPRSDEEMILSTTPQQRLQEMLDGIGQSVVVCGHTHMQFERQVATWRVINAGSVGMPYEGKPGAYWLLLGPEAMFKRTQYDVSLTAQQIRASDFPGAEEFAEGNILHPPSAAEATSIFEARAEA
jgi:putative phosphoesterase